MTFEPVATVAGTLFLFVFLFGLVFFILNIITSVWAYRDAMRRGRSREYALIVLIGTLFFPILGLVVYLIIRYD